MTQLLVVLTSQATRDVEAIQEWWSVNRVDAPELFLGELEATFRRIAQSPLSGAPYTQVPSLANVRRVLLRRTRYHVYYTHDVEPVRIVVRAVWHVGRRRGPQLP